MPRRIPFIRIGLTLVVGSLLASLITFYLSVGAYMSDMQGEAIATRPRDLAQHFTRDFLFAGAIPGIIFYVGVAVMVVGILSNFARSDKTRA